MVANIVNMLSAHGIWYGRTDFVLRMKFVWRTKFVWVRGILYGARFCTVRTQALPANSGLSLNKNFSGVSYWSNRRPL